MKKDALALESRRRIYQYIEKHPGVYMREMQKDLAMATGMLEYHLDYLVKAGLLSTEMDGRKRRYYAAEKVSAPQKKLLAFLRQKNSRRILTLSLQDSGTDMSEITEECGISKSSARTWVQRLVREGMLVEEDGRYLAKEPEELKKMLITYREGYLDEMVDRFLETFGEL